MSAVAQVIGWGFLIAALIGALVPGMNFHVGFSDDDTVIRWHLQEAQEVQKRWEKKHGKPWRAEE